MVTRLSKNALKKANKPIQPNQSMKWAALNATIRATKPGCTQAAQT